MEPTEEKGIETPEWLKDQQNKSWEPEIFISGIALTFLFLLPLEIENFCIRLIQDFAVNSLVALLVFTYLVSIIAFFKVFFIIHLLLRFAWAGMIGISYAFPEGVQNEKLFKYMRDVRYPKPVELVIKLERVCSLLFAYPTMLGVIIFALPILLCAAGLGLTFFELSFLIEVIIIYALILVIIGGFILVLMVLRKSRAADWYFTSFVGTISSIYSSNLGKWKTSFFIVIIGLVSIPFILPDFVDFIEFFEFKRDVKGWKKKEYLYAEFHQENTRYPKAFLSSEYVDGDFVSLGVVYMKADENFITHVSDNMVADSLNWKRPIEEATDLFRINIDGTPIENLEWVQMVSPGTNQKTHETAIDIHTVEPGRHRVLVEKLMLGPKGNPKVLDWVEIPFVITK